MPGKTLRQVPVRLTLYDSVKHGEAVLGDVTEAWLPTWKRSIRSVGGFWVGTARMTGARTDLEEMFLEGLMRDVRETVGSLVTWQGFVGGMELVTNGDRLTRQWGEVANAVRLIYSRVGDNLLTDGSAESAAWAAFGTPTTLEQSTTWVSHGTYACHIVTDAATEGAIIQTGITITDHKTYECRVAVNIVSGTWRLAIYRTDTGAEIATTTEGTAGVKVMRAVVADENNYAGTVGVRLYCRSGAGEIYGDEARLNEAPSRAETAWHTDTASVSEFGRMENVGLRGQLGGAAAEAEAATLLRKSAWPRTKPPDEIATTTPGGTANELWLTLYGYAFTLRNKYVLTTGTDAVSDHVSALLGAAELVNTGVVQTNALEYQIGDMAPLRAWQVLRDMVRAGDASGNRWMGGVYAGRKFDYEQASTALAYYRRGGRIWNVAGGEEEPWFAKPGLVRLDEFVGGTSGVTGDVADDPRVSFAEEVEFDAGAYLETGNGLRMRYKVDEA